MSCAPEDAPLGPRAVRILAVGFYLLLAAGGLIWTRIRTGAWLPDSLAGGDTLRSLLFGLGFALLVVGVTGPLLRFVPWMRWLALEMRKTLGPLDFGTVLAVALASGIGEEIFFRGAALPVLGLLVSSLVFGLIHTGPGVRYLAWSLFAFLVGYALGFIVLETGSLVGAIVAHVLINTVNLARISRLHV